ncbi:MAG: lipopolysaccharide assembly protein LapA domain-containing protein [Acidobacteriota bacterium]|nr:lipopolysaccharide assembly protein LapA domain-containing protein [Acidobacteriota bacterium]
MSTQAKAILAGVLGLVALVFVAQNTEVVSVRFLLWDVSMSRVVLIVLTLLVGAVIGYVLARLRPRA